MFCPLCKAEYREGFYRCADCDVPLVAALPPKPDPPPPGTDDAGPDSVVLCQEDDPAILTAILAALQDEGIHYYDFPVQSIKAEYSRPFPMAFNAAPAYEIRVAQADLPPAQKILSEILAKEDRLSREEVTYDFPNGGAEPSDAGGVEILDPEAAVAEVWSGEGSELADFLTSTLRENGIPTRREDSRAAPGRIQIFVTPEKVARAREIVREVTEGAPPG